MSPNKDTGELLEKAGNGDTRALVTVIARIVERMESRAREAERQEDEMVRITDDLRKDMRDGFRSIHSQLSKFISTTEAWKTSFNSRLERGTVRFSEIESKIALMDSKYQPVRNFWIWSLALIGTVVGGGILSALLIAAAYFILLQIGLVGAP